MPYRVEFDPLGADVSLDAPPVPDTGGGLGDIGTNHFGGIMDARWTDMFNPAGGCNLDGFAASCSFAVSWVNNGAAEDEGFVHCLGPACIFGSPSQSGGQGSPSTHETGHQGGGGRGGNAPGLFSQFASYNFGSGMNRDLPSIGDFVVNVPISFQSFSGMDLFISSGGTMIIDELSGEPQNTADLKDLSNLISGARDVIANASGDCAKILGKDALAKFNAIADNIKFDGNVGVRVEGLGGGIKEGTLSDVPEIDALTDVPNKQVYLNPNGRGFNTYTRGGQPYHPLQSTFDKFGITQEQYAFSVLIHEFLHTTGKFKPDSTIGLNGKIDSSKSREYQERLLKSCFSPKKK